MANVIDIKVTGTGADAVRTLQQVQRAGKEAGRDIEQAFTRAGRASERAVQGAARKSERELAGVGDAGKKAGKELGQGVERGAREAEAAVERVGDAADDAANQTSDAFGGLAGKMPVVGAAIGGALTAAITASIERGRIQARLEGSLDPAVAGRAGEAAGAVYADGFGENLDEVAVAMEALFQQGIVGADDAMADIREIGRQAIQTATVTGERVQDIAKAVSQMVRTGMARDAKQGFDLIVRAQQLGLNKSEDLIDTMEEYGTQFRKLGVEGPQAMGLISQGLQAGARDADTVADALKEFALRAVDGSALTAQSFEALGINARDAMAAIGQGGKPASAALNDVLIKLRQVEDPVKRAQIAVGLFGTKAEDLGDALFAMDLSGATQDFNDFEDAAKKAAEAMDTAPGEKFGEMWRGVEERMAGVGDAIAEAFELPEEFQQAQAEHEKMVSVQQAQARAAEDQRRASQSTTLSFEDQAAALAELIDKNNEFYGVQRSAIAAELRYQEAVDAGTAALKANGTTMDQGTEKGRANWSALLDLAKTTEDLTSAMADQGASATELNATHDRGRNALIALAQKMTGSRVEAEKLANQLMGMAKPYKASFDVNTSAAYSNLYGLDRYLTNMTRPRSVAINVNYRTGATPAAFAHGGTVGMPTAAEGLPHRVSGGPTGGPTVVNERGPELIDAAPGTRVHSHQDSDRMLTRAAKAGAAMAGGGLGGGGLEVRFTGNVDSAFATLFQQMIRKRQIQLVAGGRRVEVA